MASYRQDLETANKNLEEATKNYKSLAANVKVKANRRSNQFFYDLTANIDLTNKIAADFIECYILMLNMPTKKEQTEYKQGLFREYTNLPHEIYANGGTTTKCSIERSVEHFEKNEVLRKA